MFQSTQITRNSQNTLHCGGNNQIEHCSEDSKFVGVPDTLTFRMPDGTKFTMEKIDASFSLKDLAKFLHEGGGSSTRAFPATKLGCSFNFSFDGRSYPADTLLSAIHEELNLNHCGDVVCVVTEAQLAADRLKLSSGLEWRVLSEDRVVFDSNPYQKRAEAVTFAKIVSSKIPCLVPLISCNIAKIDHYFFVEMRVESRQSIRLIAQEVSTKIGLTAPSIAQALRNGDQCPLAVLPLDVLCRLGMFLAPELPGIHGYGIMQAEIEHARMKYREAPLFRKIAPVATGEIRNSIAETASMLLRCSANDSLANGRNLKVSNVTFSNARLTLDFNDAIDAGNFIRTLKHAGYRGAALEWKNLNDSNGKSVARIGIKDFNEVKRFVEVACGFDENATKELFKTAVEKPQLSSQFFIQELEAIGTSIEQMSLDEKKAAAKRFTHAYLPYLKQEEAEQLSALISEKSKPDSEGTLGSLQYLREKRGAGRIFSLNNYSDNVATYKELIAAVEGLIPRAEIGA